MVEPEAERLAAGQGNFEANGFSGHFLQDFVGRGRFEVDIWMDSAGIDRLDLLHADVQGWEVEMLEGCARGLAAGRIGRLFISTHSQALHAQVEAILTESGYRIELSSDFALHTSAYDGLICAAHPAETALFEQAFEPLSRSEIALASAAARLAYLQRVAPMCRSHGPAQAV